MPPPFRGRSASLGCCGCVTNTHDARFGIPAISIPCGFLVSGLRIALMIAGPRFSEGRILALAQAYEKATRWNAMRQKLTPDMPVPPIKGQSLKLTDEISIVSCMR
jgi:hypothetical protein